MVKLAQRQYVHLGVCVELCTSVWSCVWCVCVWIDVVYSFMLRIHFAMVSTLIYYTRSVIDLPGETFTHTHCHMSRSHTNTHSFTASFSHPFSHAHPYTHPLRNCGNIRPCTCRETHDKSLGVDFLWGGQIRGYHARTHAHVVVHPHKHMVTHSRRRPRCRRLRRRCRCCRRRRRRLTTDVWAR